MKNNFKGLVFCTDGVYPCKKPGRRAQRASFAESCTDDKSVRADPCRRADDEAIRTPATIFRKSIVFILHRAPILLGLMPSLWLQAAAADAPAANTGPVVPAGGIAQMVIGLAAVLALVAAIAWLLKRYSGLRGTGSGLIRVISGAAVGQRERIVLVEVGDTWLLVGVAPGQVRTLHSMPRNQSVASDALATSVPDSAAGAAAGFAAWLRHMSEKRA
jgi:flagellar protein FliO/FliZ